MRKPAALLLSLLCACDLLLELEGSAPGGPASPKSPAGVEAFFTTPYLVYPDKPERRSPPPFEERLIADIDAAKESVYVATFEYNLESMKEALLRAKERGVDVRLALDGENLEEEEMAAFAEALKRAKIPISFEGATAFMHSKFVIIDGAIAWTGSWNLTQNDTYRNNNNLLRLGLPGLVERYAAEFEQMSKGRFGKKKESREARPVRAGSLEARVFFSPQDGVERYVLERLRGAKRSIRFLAFSFTSDPIAEVMLERKAAGVSVSGVFEARNARGTGSELEALVAGGVEALEDGNCYTMHHKVIIIDEATVITGSYNFSKRAEDTNDENLLILDDPGLAALYLEEFERVFAQAKSPTRCGKTK